MPCDEHQKVGFLRSTSVDPHVHVITSREKHTKPIFPAGDGLQPNSNGLRPHRDLENRGTHVQETHARHTLTALHVFLLLDVGARRTLREVVEDLSEVAEGSN